MDPTAVMTRGVAPPLMPGEVEFDAPDPDHGGLDGRRWDKMLKEISSLIQTKLDGLKCWTEHEVGLQDALVRLVHALFPEVADDKLIRTAFGRSQRSRASRCRVKAEAEARRMRADGSLSNTVTGRGKPKNVDRPTWEKVVQEELRLLDGRHPRPHAQQRHAASSRKCWKRSVATLRCPNPCGHKGVPDWKKRFKTKWLRFPSTKEVPFALTNGIGSMADFWTPPGDPSDRPEDIHEVPDTQPAAQGAGPRCEVAEEQAAEGAAAEDDEGAAAEDDDTAADQAAAEEARRLRRQRRRERRRAAVLTKEGDAIVAEEGGEDSQPTERRSGRRLRKTKRYIQDTVQGMADQQAKASKKKKQASMHPHKLTFLLESSVAN